MTKCYQVKINGLEPFAVDADNEQTSLLEAMEQAGLETHYHCRSGFCGACRTKLISGDVTYLNEPLAYVRSGDILPCVCIAASDLEIEH